MEREVFFRGKTYPTKTACCEAFGVPHGPVSDYQHRHGTTFGKALAETIRRYNLRTYKGKKYKSAAECCAENNVPYHYILRKIRENGTTLEEEIDSYLSSEKPRMTRKPAFYHGEAWKSWSVLAEACGIDPKTLPSDRHKNGEDFIDRCIASGTAHKPSEEAKEKARCLVIEGKAYRGISSACRSLGISENAVRDDIEFEGYTPEEAIIDVLRYKRYRAQKGGSL